MARARREMTEDARQAATEQAEQANASQGGLSCPECGKPFTRAASLGAHRKNVHGVAGASRQMGGRRPRRARATAAATRSEATRRTRSAPRRAAAAGSAGDGKIDRDRLLQTLFPNGIPAREDIIRRANAWLDEAERLAKAR